MKKRKLKVKNLIILIVILCAIIASVILLITNLFKNSDNNVDTQGDSSILLKEEYFGNKAIHSDIFKNFDLRKMYDANYFSYSDTKELPFDIYSQNYMLVDISNRNVLYSCGIEDRCFPASLTKLLTLDTLLNVFGDTLDDVSSFTSYQKSILIEDNASLSYIEPNKEYTLRNLCYALILPSGADAAIAIENYFNYKGLDLIDEMNKQAVDLELTSTHVANSIGLDNVDHYMCVDDVFKIVLDILKYSEGKKVLTTLRYYISDDFYVDSTLSSLSTIESVEILGGKTGFTGWAKENIAVYFCKDDNYYLLILTGADGNPYNGEFYHIQDVRKIIEYLFE